MTRSLWNFVLLLGFHYHISYYHHCMICFCIIIVSLIPTTPCDDAQSFVITLCLFLIHRSVLPTWLSCYVMLEYYYYYYVFFFFFIHSFIPCLLQIFQYFQYSENFIQTFALKAISTHLIYTYSIFSLSFVIIITI